MEERLMGPPLFLAKSLEKGDTVFSCVPMGEPTRLHWIIQIYGHLVKSSGSQSRQTWIWERDMERGGIKSFGRR